ncbi:hypothetical protein [Alicyclobacillus sp. ALC3]|uniref:hypothetical protein n=1 Tax=Alicyclobacillus sp. ALC3 TaxID=2796143 RepID=UPI00237977F5|nr:hypothetical protein [Alicyclobacillus sp. ALC3]
MPNDTKQDFVVDSIPMAEVANEKTTMADGRIAVTSGLVEPAAGVIYEDDLLDAHQDVAYPISGLVILAPRGTFSEWMN